VNCQAILRIPGIRVKIESIKLKTGNRGLQNVAKKLVMCQNFIFSTLKKREANLTSLSESI
jgi:hypothetical protein